MEKVKAEQKVMRCYNYGEEVNYSIDLLTPEDQMGLQVFSCGNEVIDKYVKEECFENFYDGDGRHYKIIDNERNKIIGFVSLAASGIVYKVDNYTRLLPAIKIDVIALDEEYQHLHYDIDSERDQTGEDHYYFSDQILSEVIKGIRSINENKILVKYIILYAEPKKEGFYVRNHFEKFIKYMEPEHNQEINKEIPMFMEI